MMVEVVQRAAEDFLSLTPETLKLSFKDLSIVEIDNGSDRQPLFISVMLHGNEPAGLQVIQKLFLKLKGQLPRPLILLMGNMDAAEKNARYITGQKDYNRIWKPISDPGLFETKAQAILDYLRGKNLFAGVDIHNNTGTNPPYACMNRLDLKLANIAKAFGPISVYFKYPDKVLSIALNAICPSVTIECGVPGNEEGIERGVNTLEYLMNIEQLESCKLNDGDLSIYHSFASVHVPENVTFSFDENELSDLCLRNDLDGLNFQTVKIGESMGLQHNPNACLEVRDEMGRDLSKTFFEYVSGKVRAKKTFVPSMFTVSPDIVKQDCLGYLMEEFSLELINNS